MLLSILLFIASIPLLAEPSAGDTLLRQEMLKAERLDDYTYLIAAMNYDEDYVIAVEYDLRPAPVTLYYTDPCPSSVTPHPY